MLINNLLVMNILACVGILYLIIIFINIIISTYKFIKITKDMNEQFQSLRKTLKDSNFFEEALKPMTEEEKEKLEKEGSVKTEVSLNLKTGEVSKKEIKNETN